MPGGGEALSASRLILIIIIGAIIGVLIGKPIYELMTSNFDPNPLVMLGFGILFAAFAYTYFNRASAWFQLPVLGAIAVVLIILGLMGVGN